MGDEFGIAQACEADLGPVPEEHGRQKDFENEIESGAVGQKVSVAVLAAFHMPATLQVFPICFPQLNCCSSTCIHQEMCALSSKILEDLKSLLQQEQQQEMSRQLVLLRVEQQGCQWLFVSHFRSKATVV